MKPINYHILCNLSLVPDHAIWKLFGLHHKISALDLAKGSGCKTNKDILNFLVSEGYTKL